MTAAKEQSKKKTKDGSEEPDFSDQSPSQRNYKGIAISLLVIVVVCSLITLSVVVLTPAEGASGFNSKLTVSDLFSPEFTAHDPHARWISESEVVYRNRDGHVIKFDFASNETDILLRNSTFISFKVAKYELSSDLKYALFAYDVKQVYQYSYTASYIVYNIHTREVWELNPPEVQNAVLQHAAWGSQGQQLIYIFENNIHYQSDVRSNSLRITSSGMEGVVFNGIADWLYEEEILQSHIAHWWSPDGERLAYLTINDTLVPNMVIPQFTGSTYPKGLQFPYPMAGQPNPTVRVFVVNLYGPTHTLELVPPDDLRFREVYVAMVEWTSSTHVAVRWLNRAQNASLLSLCDATSGTCVKKHEETTDLWLTNQNQVPVFSKDASRLFLTLPVKQGGQGEFRHLTMFTKKMRGDQNEVRHLTSGNWEVTRIAAYDEDNQILYYLSTEHSPQTRHLYSVSTVGLFPRRCVTCELNLEECTFFDANASPDTQHVILPCKGPGVPSVLLLSFDNVNSYFLLENNMPLRVALESKIMPETEVRVIASDGFELPLRLTYPPDFSDSYLYGLLLLVDGPPGRQAVSEEFKLDWDTVLLGSEEVIVARLDGRGSGFQGQRLLQEIHHKLGAVEVHDQIAALEHLVKLPYIDRTRVGVYGKGYGGYVALMMLRSSESLIQCAAVQAPVVDWTMYEGGISVPNRAEIYFVDLADEQKVESSAFSERYLGLPSKGHSRYQFSSVLPSLKGPHGQSLFIAHGTADANVHFQHSAELIKHFIKTGANYTLQIYPDEGHFLSARSRQQLSQSLIGYFRGCLLGHASTLPEQQRDDE